MQNIPNSNSLPYSLARCGKQAKQLCVMWRKCASCLFRIFIVPNMLPWRYREYLQLMSQKIRFFWSIAIENPPLLSSESPWHALLFHGVALAIRYHSMNVICLSPHHASWQLLTPLGAQYASWRPSSCLVSQAQHKRQVAETRLLLGWRPSLLL